MMPTGPGAGGNPCQMQAINTKAPICTFAGKNRIHETKLLLGLGRDGHDQWPDGVDSIVGYRCRSEKW